MNIVEKNMDAYEIAHNLYNDTIFTPNDIVTIENLDLKMYFEMLLIIFLEGLYKFCRYSINDNYKFDLNIIKPNDIIKINSYFNKINVTFKFTLFNMDDWYNTNITKYKSYDKIEIDSNTKLDELYTIFYVHPNVYVVNFIVTQK
tara:strand:- start:728 stop:1162 length:435 start_codon:yes stop_codon:yes gene_type:complete